MCIAIPYKFTEQHLKMGPKGDRFKAPKEEVYRHISSEAHSDDRQWGD